jgi:hypothetical protein
LTWYTIKIYPNFSQGFTNIQYQKVRINSLFQFLAMKTILQNIGYNLLFVMHFSWLSYCVMIFLLFNDFHYTPLIMLNAHEFHVCLHQLVANLHWFGYKFGFKYLTIWSWYIVSKNAYNMMNDIWVTLYQIGILSLKTWYLCFNIKFKFIIFNINNTIGDTWSSCN